MPEDVVSQYYLHVQEIRTNYQPAGLPSLRVQVLRTPEGLVDQCTLNDVRLGRSDWLTIEPHGRGWTVYDANNDGNTVWRRKHHEQ